MSITGEVFTGDLHAISASFCGDKRLPHKLSLEPDWRWEIFNRAESLYRGRFDICSSRLSFRTTLSIIGSELWGDVHIFRRDNRIYQQQVSKWGFVGIFNPSCALNGVFGFKQSEEFRGASTLGTLSDWCVGHQPNLARMKFTGGSHNSFEFDAKKDLQ